MNKWEIIYIHNTLVFYMATQSGRKPHKNIGELCMCMIAHFFIVYLLCNYWMIMLHWYNTWILSSKMILLLYYWFTPPLSNPIIGIKFGSFKKQFNHWKEIMDYFENGVPIFNGQNGLNYDMWSRRKKLFL